MNITENRLEGLTNSQLYELQRQIGEEDQKTTAWSEIEDELDRRASEIEDELRLASRD
jgi:hypothetical protein